jgi:sensor histidine kinase regulating citrate/malate metabolism
VCHEHYLINAVAHDLSLRARSLGIKTVLNLKASPLDISEPDLISLLTNITDNALEACAKLPEGQERFINFSITRRDPYLVIVCESSNPGGIVTDTDGEIRSSKNETGHGYGLKTIRRIAAVYDGMAEYSYDEKSFTITVALKDKQNEPVQK